MTLCRAGSGKTSGALSLVNQMGNEQEYLVWNAIFTGLAKVKAVWWEQPENVRKAIDKLQVKLAKPLVDKLGYEFPEGEDPTTRELRSLAISIAAGSEDAEWVAVGLFIARPRAHLARVQCPGRAQAPLPASAGKGRRLVDPS